MSAKSNVRSRIAALVSGLAIAMGSGAVLAQPMHGPGFGHGARGGGPDHFAQIIAQYKSQLALNSSQQQMWDNAVAATQQARQNGRALMQPLHDAMRAELAKPDPDLAAIAAMADDAQTKGQALRKQVRDEWLKLYATFTPEQKAVVRDALVARMQRQDQMLQRFQQRSGPQG